MESLTSMDKPERHVLLVVEGDKAEKELVDALFRAFNPNAKWHVHPYHTVIHDLIERIVDDYDGDYDNIELCNVLADMLLESQQLEREKLLNTKFTDVILMFDFDPQDNRLNPIELRKMLKSFDDSTDTDRGLLLLNYPAIESVKEAAALGFEDYLDRYCYINMGQSYKASVNTLIGQQKGKFNSFKDYTSAHLTRAIAWTVSKVQHLLSEVPAEQTFRFSGKNDLAKTCRDLSRMDLLDYQLNECFENGRVATCGTGPFFIAIWEKALDGAWKSLFGE